MEEVDVLFEGDTVRLAFGGPLMTVLRVKADRCCCFWFDENGRFSHGEFEREVVRFVQPAVRLIPDAEPFWRRPRSIHRRTANPAHTPASSAGTMRSILQ